MTKAQDQLKARIKKMVGEDKYLTFMGKLTGGLTPLVDLAKEYDVNSGTLSGWLQKLDVRSGRTRQAIRSHYKIAARVKERRENMYKILQILQKS